MQTYKDWITTLLILLLTFSTIFQICLCSSPISDALSTVFSQYIDRIIRQKRTDSVATDTGVVESRGDGYGGGGSGSNGHGKGYGGGGYDSGGGGGYGHGAITLDPVSIISLLALGAFLINNILQLLRANAAPAPAPIVTPIGRRSLNLDINVPLDLGSFASVTGKMEYGDGKKRSLNDASNEPSFSQFFENVGSLYYLHPKKRNICIKKVVCGYVNAQQARETQGTLKTRIFDLMLTTITRFVAPEIAEEAKPELCHKFNKLCSDSLLHDAKVSTENKVYGHVTTFISNFAMSNFMAG